MQLTNQTLSLIGLASRARKIESGSEVINLIRKRKCYLILICNDASEPTKKKLIDKCTYYSIEYLLVDDSELLSKAIGKSNRKALAVTEQGFANGIKKKLGQGI
jgi:Ribosomal protein HS6-type (S12/L30/L7a)